VTDKSGKQDDQDATHIPLDRLPENAWTAADLEDIEAYCLHLRQVENDEQLGIDLFVVIDFFGIKNKTCILASMPDNYYENPETFWGRYEKIRVPWGDLYIIWCNLNIANMNFEEFVEEEEGDEQGWFTYQSVYEGDEEHQKGLERRDRKLRAWRRLGHV